MKEMGMMVGAGGVPVWTENRYGTAAGGGGSVSTAEKTAVQKTTGGGKKRKRLYYNYREVSGRILRAKTSVSAALVVTRARTVVAMLRRKYGCGEFNDKELETAIIHAEKMVRIAKKKLKNLKMEERGQRVSEAEEAEEERSEYEGGYLSGTEDAQPEDEELNEEELKEMLRELEQELRELEAENRLDDLTDEAIGGSGVLDKEDLERMKKKHRCDEMRQIVEADMKYLKAVFQQMMQEQQEVAAAATLELSAAAVGTPVTISLAAAAGVPAAGANVNAAV